MDARYPEVGKRIKRLRDFLRIETQEAFAKVIGVDQTRISQWEAGRSLPSAEAWMRLGALAAKGDPAEARFFLEHSGIDPSVLVSWVNALIRAGQAEPGPLVSTIRAVLKEQLADQKELAEAGKVILVPPYGQGGWKGLESPPLPLPAWTILNTNSTFYLSATSFDSHARRMNRGFVNGDLIVFDTYGSKTRKFHPFLESLVLVNFTGHHSNTPQSGSWREGLFVGVLTLSSEDDAYWVVLTPPEEIVMLSRRGQRHSVPHVLARLASFRIEDYLPKGYSPTRTTDFTKDHFDHLEAIHAAESAALSELMVPEGCEIMGHIVARFSATGPGLRLQWESWPAEQLKRLDQLEKARKDRTESETGDDRKETL